jgi:hypothetical protein
VKIVAITVAITVGSLWLMGMLVMTPVGIIEGINGTKKGPPRRIEYVVPGYRIGYWLGSPAGKP